MAKAQQTMERGRERPEEEYAHACMRAVLGVSVRHDATTKILRKSIDASEAIRASSRRLGAAAFDFCVLHHHIELLSAPSPSPMQHNSGGIMLHQGELWESGHVTEEGERILNTHPHLPYRQRKARPS